jgi:hypothetical protein
MSTSTNRIMKWFRIKEYIAGYLTVYVVPAENDASVVHKMKEAGYYNENAKYEFDEIEWNNHVAKILEVDVW